MTKRETRVINAFTNCVKTGEYRYDYAVLLIEDNQKYGWLSEDAKDVFYEAVQDEKDVVLEEEVEQVSEDLPEEEVNDDEAL